MCSAGSFYYSGRALGPDTKLIHLDQAHSEVGKSEPTDIGIIADPKTGLAHLAEALESTMSGSDSEAAKGRAANLAERKAEMDAAVQRRLGERWDMSPMSTERMMREVASALPPGTLIADGFGHDAGRDTLGDLL